MSSLKPALEQRIQRITDGPGSIEQRAKMIALEIRKDSEEFVRKEKQQQKEIEQADSLIDVEAID